MDPLAFGLAAWRAGAPLPGLAGWAAIAGSALVHAVYSLVLQKDYQESDFTVVYPLARGTGPLFSVFGAILVLGELPSPLGWLGIIAILAGILMISGNARLLAAPLPRLRAGLFWGVLTGLCIAAYTVIDGWAVKALAIQPVIYYVLSLVLRTTLLTPQALRAPQRLRAQWRANARHVVVVGALSPAAYTLVLFAMTLAPLSYVAPVRELSMLIGILFGARLLREAFSLLRVIGVVSMVAGVLMISFAG